METLILKKISKAYPINKSQQFYALRDINLSFPSTGLHGIIGKSGSGKSTLLNIIGGLDTPTTGDIFLNGNRYKNKQKDTFFKEDVAIVFQRYFLLEDRTVLYNVALPLLIKGVKKKVAYKKAEQCLRYINLSTYLYNQKCALLSGGEKQRVSIARAIIKNPKILLCDEPTGALDSANSNIVLELLKKISKERLVIVVSHNLQLIYGYSDRIIEISDGKIIQIQTINESKNAELISSKQKRKLSNWAFDFALTNYRRRIKRNLLVSISLVISILMVNIVAGFMNGKDNAIRNSCYKQLDFGSGQISKEERVSNSGALKMVKLVRPDFRELENNAKICAIFEIKPNFAAILPQNIEVLYDGYELDNLKFNPVYSFTNSSFNRQLLSKGTVPEIDDLVNVIINNSAYKNIKRHIKKNPLGEYLDFRYSINVNYITETGEYITDTFDYFAHSKIIGVVNELDYLNTPKIYYSYIALENYMQEHVLNNLSTYYGVKITWYDRILNADNYSYLSSYSYQLFLKDYHYRNYLFDFDIFPEQFSFTSSSLIISDSLFGFVDVAKYALVLFLGISLIGTLVITSIMSFTSYSEDRKVSAILSSLGARNGDIQEIYLNESIITAFISSFIALLLSIPISKIVNSIIQKKISVNGLISIPYLNFLNVPLLYPLLIIFGALLVAYIATIVPIIFSKQKTIKGELQTND